MTFGTSIALATIGAVLVFLRPWRVHYGTILRFAGPLMGSTLFLGILAAATSYYLRTFVDDNSPLRASQAGLLVAVPGITGQVVALVLLESLRDTLGWSG